MCFFLGGVGIDFQRVTKHFYKNHENAVLSSIFGRSFESGGVKKFTQTRRMFLNLCHATPLRPQRVNYQCVAFLAALRDTQF
jgi:hypothetical protein